MAKSSTTKDVKFQFLSDKLDTHEDIDGSNNVKRGSSSQINSGANVTHNNLVNSSNQGLSMHKLPPIKTIPEIGEDDFNVLQKLVSDKDKSYQLDGVNPVDVSKKILLKCNIIRNRHEGVSVLLKGNGHLIGSDKTIGEIYQDVYHRII